MLRGGGSEEEHLGATRRLSAASGTGLARADRWVTASLVAAAGLALLILANSIENYLSVSRLLTVLGRCARR